MANNVLAKMAVIITANNAEFNRKLAQSQGSLKSFTGSIGRLASTLGLAFGLRELASFTVGISKLAGETEGVRAAFERLPQSAKLMNDLKEATGGTVSELGLMKRAVQASNFDISLKALPKLLEFATLRAQQTGQSVDYLVDSIVTGIGRKSKLILDNLGISAVQLTEALGGASAASSSIGEVADAVGRIAEKNLANMAKFSENASTGMQRLAASWENLKAAMGSDSGGAIAETLTLMAKGLDLLNRVLKNERIEVLDKIAEGAEGLTGSFNGLAVQEIVNALQKLRDARSEAARSGDIEQWGRLNEVIQRGTEKLRILTDTTKTQVVPALDEEARSLAEISAEWDRLNNKKPFNPADSIANKTGSDFLFDTGSLAEMANAGGSALEKMNGALQVNSNAWDVWAASVNANAQMVAEIMEKHEEKTQRLAEVSQTVGTAMGEAFSALAFGQEDLLQSMLRSTEQIINMFLQQSIAAMIAAAIKDPSMPFPFGKIAIAAAGIAAVKGLFSQLGASAGGGGSAGASAPGKTPSETKVNIGGSIRGYDIAVNQQKESYRRGRMG